MLDRVAEELAHRVPFRPNPERGRQYEPGTGEAFVVAVALQHRDRLARQLFLLLRSRLTPQGRDERELEPRSNLQVIETPEFMRGIYAVGGFNPAPALEPQLGAFYWITPIPQTWKPERVESKLREYNFYNLKLLTIHEAMPGHYVQFEYANDMQPQSRRLLRSVFGNNPYVEGWAQYATQVMLDSGFLNNSPELRLTFQKQELRVLANMRSSMSSVHSASASMAGKYPSTTASSKR